MRGEGSGGGAVIGSKSRVAAPPGPRVARKSRAAAFPEVPLGAWEKKGNGYNTYKHTHARTRAHANNTHTTTRALSPTETQTRIY